jgi:translation initiation factor 1 (eIF-1/SUI1)
MGALAAVIASLPLLYILQASIDAALERADAGRQQSKPSRKIRIRIKRSKRRAAVAILREIEREMRREQVSVKVRSRFSGTIRIRSKGERDGI